MNFNRRNKSILGHRIESSLYSNTVIYNLIYWPRININRPTRLVQILHITSTLISFWIYNFFNPFHAVSATTTDCNNNKNHRLSVKRFNCFFINLLTWQFSYFSSNLADSICSNASVSRNSFVWRIQFNECYFCFYTGTTEFRV